MQIIAIENVDVVFTARILRGLWLLPEVRVESRTSWTGYSYRAGAKQVWRATLRAIIPQSIANGRKCFTFPTCLSIAAQFHSAVVELGACVGNVLVKNCRISAIIPITTPKPRYCHENQLRKRKTPSGRAVFRHLALLGRPLCNSSPREARLRLADTRH